jgi:hypothetical protein
VAAALGRVSGSARAAALVVLAACSRERAAAVDAALPAYRVVAVPAAGMLTGLVTMPAGAPPQDVIVWLDGVRAGKPLPLARRYEIDHEANAIVPPVQASMTGGTLNVRNADDTRHRARFTLTGAKDSLLGVVEETGAGQVVPAPKLLARAGLIVITCDDHPATRGWIKVFDQPYYANVDSAGRFVMDSVPPGRWKLHAWNPKLGERVREVTVDSAGLAFIDLSYPR